MTQHRVIQGDFCNWRPVVGRKVLQITIEVPIEQTKDVLEKLGQPVPGQNLWVAVALLDPEKLATPTSSEPKVSGSTNHSGRKWEDIPLSQQAGIRCQEDDFRAFLKLNYPEYFDGGETTAQILRVLLGIESRNVLDRDAKLAQDWRGIEAEYQTYRVDRQYAEARR